MEMSELKPYSIGVVAANKKLGSKEIEVIASEDSPMLNGEVTDSISNYTASAKDADGGAYHVDIKATASIQATWLPLGSDNRLTAPDVRRGESVVLYRFADSDKFWWTTLHCDMKLRKLETVIYGFSATMDESATPSAENMYFLEVSSHQKHIHFHTSKANGEPYAYDIQINTGLGFIRIQDDAGNYFSFDSKERQIMVANDDGSLIDMNKRTLSFIALDRIDFKSKVISTSASELVETKSKTITDNATDVKITAHTTHTGNVEQNGNTDHKGNVLLAGNISSTPGSAGSGTATFAGDIRTDKGITTGGIITTTGVNSSGNVNAPNIH
jgi:hypothetical protein